MKYKIADIIVDLDVQYPRLKKQIAPYEYDEAAGEPMNGIKAGTKVEDLPDDFECPLCGVGKDMFSEE